MSEVLDADPHGDLLAAGSDEGALTLVGTKEMARRIAERIAIRRPVTA